MCVRYLPINICNRSDHKEYREATAIAIQEINETPIFKKGIIVCHYSREISFVTFKAKTLAKQRERSQRNEVTHYSTWAAIFIRASLQSYEFVQTSAFRTMSAINGTF